MEWVTEMDKMIDFHSHILPKIDDGSKSSDESIEILLAERQQGVSDIIATPHFYAHDVSIFSLLRAKKSILRQTSGEDRAERSTGRCAKDSRWRGSVLFSWNGTGRGACKTLCE